MKVKAFKGAKWDRQAHEAAKAAAKALREDLKALQSEVENLKKDKGGK